MMTLALISGIHRQSAVKASQVVSFLHTEEHFFLFGLLTNLCVNVTVNVE